MAKRRKQTLRLKEGHQWKAKPGFKIFVADRGSVRFDFPESWVVLTGTDAIIFHDQPPPDDNCRLQVSVMYLPEGIDWSQLSLRQMFEEALKGSLQEVLSRGEINQVERPGVELVWMETRYVDPGEHREARTRSCLARGSNVQPFITMDFWPEDAPRFEPVWDEILRSLRLGEYITDPTRGIRLGRG